MNTIERNQRMAERRGRKLLKVATPNPCDVCGQDTAVRSRCPYCNAMCCSTCRGQRATATKGWRRCRKCR